MPQSDDGVATCNVAKTRNSLESSRRSDAHSRATGHGGAGGVLGHVGPLRAVLPEIHAAIRTAIETVGRVGRGIPSRTGSWGALLMSIPFRLICD